MFQTAAGVRIPFPEKLSEQYQQDGDTLTLQLRTVYNYAITVATDAGSETFLVMTEMD